MNRKLRILILSNPISVHSIRWVKQLKETGWDIRLFSPVAPKWSVWASSRYQKLIQRNTTEISPIIICTEKYIMFYRLLNLIYLGFKIFSRIIDCKFLIIDQFFNIILEKIWTEMFNDLLDNFQPDIVHSLGINQDWRNLCIPVLEKKKNRTMNVPWVYSSWGTDLSFYVEQFPQNLDDVKEIVQSVDYYLSECKRDYEMAIKYGFRGQYLGIFPAFGGINIESMKQFRAEGLCSNRKSIYIKGRGIEDPVGNAIVILEALEKLHLLLINYQIFIGQATPSIIQKALEIRLKYNLNIVILPFMEDPKAVFNYVGTSRLFISITKNDGLPASLVEAMALGALPIFSNLPSICEWITHGINGFLVDGNNIEEELVMCIIKGLEDDELANRAEIINGIHIREKLEYERIKESVISMYSSIAI